MDVLNDARPLTAGSRAVHCAPGDAICVVRGSYAHACGGLFLTVCGSVHVCSVCSPAAFQLRKPLLTPSARKRPARGRRAYFCAISHVRLARHGWLPGATSGTMEYDAVAV